MAARYIPGLTLKPEDPDKDVIPDQTSAKVQCPPKLKKMFLSGAKNPVMCAHELASIYKLPLEFREVSVTRGGMILGGFACECILDGVTYPQGIGKTKKEAKIDAARIAMNGYLGIDNYLPGGKKCCN